MKPIKIAICDDEKVLRDILLQEIEKHCKNTGIPCQIFDYDSGEKLLALPAKNIPDILFLDIQMPGKNGMQTARELRRKNENMILIFVTALSEYVYDAFDVNAFHYLVKPFEEENCIRYSTELCSSIKKRRSRHCPGQFLSNRAASPQGYCSRISFTRKFSTAKSCSTQ